MLLEWIFFVLNDDSLYFFLVEYKMIQKKNAKPRKNYATQNKKNNHLGKLPAKCKN